MKGEWITVSAADSGSFRAYLSRPARGSGPGLLLLQEIFGVNETMRAQADELAEAGYVVVVPDLFWRLEPGVELDYSPEGWQRAFELYGKFDEGKAVEDIAATLEVLRRHPACEGKVGAIGYCLGGRLAFLTGCRTNLDCSVCYYGVGIEKNLDEIENIKRPMVMHFAELDKFAPPEAVARIKAASVGRPDIEIYEYPRVDHAFARVGGDHYDEPSAKLANSRSLAFLRRVLEPA
jgi:carboxymethylenebutenolidase